MRRHIDLPGLRWQRITPEPASDPGLAPFRSGHDLFGDGSLVLLPTPGHTPGSMSLLVRRPGRPPLLMVGDVTYDAHLLECGHVPGVGNRRLLRDATAMVNQMRQRHPGLVILPAHDPGAASRLAQATGQASDPGDGVAMPGLAIDALESVQSGGDAQWIRVRGTDTANPVLLLIQQGPGLPMINEARRSGCSSGWSECSRSCTGTSAAAAVRCARRTDRRGLSLERLISDTVSLLGFLRDRFGAKSYVAGFSFGATLGAYAAAQRPDLVAVAGGDRHGHRRCRRRTGRLRLRAGAPPASAATGARSGSWRPSGRPRT